MSDVLTPAPERRTAPPQPGGPSVFVGSLWMVGLTLVLSFIPFVNGLIGGLVGGYKMRSLKGAVIAALLPAAIVAAALWVLFIAFRLPLTGLAAGVTIGVLILLSDVGLMLGAIVGGGISGTSRSSRTGWITRH